MNTNDIIGAFLEEGVPFDKKAATLQYRPYRLQDVWKWYWVLLPEDGTKALACGTANDRAQAGIDARLKARKQGIVITKIELKKAAVN